jgi:hypothetical protein
MIRYIMTKVFKKKYPEHDPLDFSYNCGTSTQWTAYNSCHECNAGISHDEYMSDTCGSCGSTLVGHSVLYRTKRRKIYFEGKWCIQYIFGKSDTVHVDRQVLHTDGTRESYSDYMKRKKTKK